MVVTTIYFYKIGNLTRLQAVSVFVSVEHTLGTYDIPAIRLTIMTLQQVETLLTSSI